VLQKNSKDIAKSPWYWLLPIVALCTMLIISFSGSNKALFLILNSALYINNEYIWLNITLFGDAAMAAVILLPLIWRRPDIIWAALIAGFITAIMVNVGKNYFALPRPPGVLDAEVFHQFGNLFTVKSFPSGHTAAAFSVAAVVILSIRQLPVQILVLICAILVGVSRIAIGAHWPMDVLAGAFVAWLPAIIGIILAQNKRLYSKYAVLFPAALLLTVAYYLVFIHTRGDAQARLVEISVPIICVIIAIPAFIKIIKKIKND